VSPETIAAIGAFVGTVGFPAFVATFVLWRLERTLQGVRDTLADVAAILRTFRDRDDVEVKGRRARREE
jgi:hypothetical protein